ncbi:Fic family protein [Kitasatospora sp. NPDC090308]|uniref:Fic family protein n=1 Tax=Kitasatospora sp. NPDC090308 TaxID=3364082 RepID=UPI00380D2736
MLTTDADALAGWRAVRRQVDWAGAAPAGEYGPLRPATDGLAAWIAAQRVTRGAPRAERLLAAAESARADAARGLPLTPELLLGWQRLVLGDGELGFRRTDAFAKGGRERYGYAPSLRDDLAACLRESADPGLPLPARAARAYLDVAFFHLFADGNGRCAMLVLCYVLELAGVRLDLVGPLAVARYPDDPAGAADLALLVSVLIRAARRRADPGPDPHHR